MTMHSYKIHTNNDADSMAFFNSARGAVYHLGGTIHVAPPGGATPLVYVALPTANTPADISSDANYPSSFTAITSGTSAYQYEALTIGEIEAALASDPAPEVNFPEDPEIELDSDLTNRND